MNKDWFKIGGENPAGLGQKIEYLVEQRIQSGEYSQKEVDHLASLSRPVLSEKLMVTGEKLEKLRAMCQAWDIELRPVQISSHRRVIGPIIVAFKRAIQPFIRALLKDTIKQQRNFNASVITAITDLSNELEKLRALSKGD